MWTPGPEILTCAELNEIDRLTAASGVPTLTLMENAGRQIANEIVKRWTPRRTTVFCGPGNNGGDGYVVARHLRARGWAVELVAVGDHKALKADAAAMAALWDGQTRTFDPKEPVHGDLFVDAIFGAGLTRGLSPELSQLFRDIDASDAPVVAVDVPSGVGGDQARFLDTSQPWTAALTVTFFRKKPAHVLHPAKGACGEIVCVDIGIPAGMLQALANEQSLATGPHLLCTENLTPPLPPALEADTHKYRRGHCIAVSGPASATGAARLAARGALRVGAGLVTVVGDAQAVETLGASLTAIMVRKADTPTDLEALLKDKRLNAVVIGPGNGIGEATRERVAVALATEASVVLDADALTSFADQPAALFGRLSKRCVLTPHAGEFERLFPGLLGESSNRIEAARTATKRAGAIILLKGPDTVVAEPSGEATVNTNAPPDLATAGAGDVLAGMVAGLLAQGMTAFDAARAAAFIHAACGRIAGPGLIAEDLPDLIPQVLQSRGNPPLGGL